MRRNVGSVALGAALLVWPGFLNGYPILFSDTGGLLLMGFGPSMGWDKPWVYGPLLAATSLGLTLWLPLAAQGLLLSYLLWITCPARHLLLCAILAVASAAPWITATLMPDLFTPIVVLGIAALTLEPARLGRSHRVAVMVITMVAIAAHLSHLILAAACIATAALLRRAVPWRPLASVAGALLFLLASNGIGHGRFGVSPYGSVFALARLVANGPARDYLAQSCPAAGYVLCRWQDRLTDDSDQFLWDPGGPFWADPTPLPTFAAQASQIVIGTIRAYPLRVARDALRNTIHELGRVTLGDTLTPAYLNESVRRALARFLPAEVPRYDGSLQAAGKLLAAAQTLIPLQLAALGAGALACALILIRSLRGPNEAADFAALILIAVAANAFSTGALSTPHDRYQVRIAWLVLLPPLLALPRWRLGIAQPFRVTDAVPAAAPASSAAPRHTAGSPTGTPSRGSSRTA
jgi:hypothetical protein